MKKIGKFMTCENCQKSVYMPPYRQNKFRFCSSICHAKHVLVGSKRTYTYGRDNPKFKGGYIEKRGYRRICVMGKQVYEHRYVMEQYLGRKLNFDETIHHKNGNRFDNRMENLELMSRSEHTIKNPLKPYIDRDENKICDGCEKEYQRGDRPASKWIKSKFCSHRCYLLNVKRNYHGYMMKN